MPHVTMMGAGGRYMRQIDTSDTATLAAWLVEAMSQLSEEHYPLQIQISPLFNTRGLVNGPDWPTNAANMFRVELEAGVVGRQAVIGLRAALEKYLETL